MENRRRKTKNIYIEMAQVYLNSMYGHHPEWVPLDEDGYTGTLLCEGIIRAFQIENGISPVSGYVGDITLNRMRQIPNIVKMDPDDEPSANVCLIQCALFAKGYNAGGITGIYYTTGVAAIELYQEEAGIDISGIIDWKVWMGLVSIHWFTRTLSGDYNIVKIQRQLNSEWSDIIGIGPCDGVTSRFTAYAVIAALQACEGIYTEFMGNLDGIDFGPKTTSLFPTALKEGQNGSYIKYNKLVQYGLYMNGYNPGRFDGIFDSVTASKVAEMQIFYALNNINLVTLGEVNCATMKSLLSSKGDTNRLARACDCSTVLNRQQALDIKSAGFDIVGRYLTGTVGIEETRKFITFNEIDNIKNANLNVFPIYQNGGHRLEYFQDKRQGVVDAHTAIYAAQNIGVPNGTTIYFAVDFDCYGYQMDDYVIPYFKKVNMIFNGSKNIKNYKVGVYAPRFICTQLYDLGLTKYSFVADMSTGFSCNLGYPIPENWAFDQFYELGTINKCQFQSSPSFDLDKVGYSGRDTGISIFDDVERKSPEVLEKLNNEALLNIQIDQYICNVFEPLGYLDKVKDSYLVHEGEFPLATFIVPGILIEISANITNTFMKLEELNKVVIELKSNGELSDECSNNIDNLLGGVSIDVEEALTFITNTLSSMKTVAVSITEGNIGFKFELEDGLPKLIFIVTTEDIFPEDPTQFYSLTTEICYKITPMPLPEIEYTINVEQLMATVLTTASIIALLALLSNPVSAGYAIPTLVSLGAIATG